MPSEARAAFRWETQAQRGQDPPPAEAAQHMAALGCTEAAGVCRARLLGCWTLMSPPDSQAILLPELSRSQWPTACTPFSDEKTESPEIAGQRTTLPGRSQGSLRTAVPQRWRPGLEQRCGYGDLHGPPNPLPGTLTHAAWHPCSRPQVDGHSRRRLHCYFFISLP